MRRIPFFEHRRRAKIDAEISEGISFLRNLPVIGEGRRLSADSVIEQLADRRGMLSPVYGKMLRLLRQNQRGEAVDCFTRETDTEIGKDFGRLLIQWDEHDPGNLLETLLSHQKSIKERRITEMKKRDEMISDLMWWLGSAIRLSSWLPAEAPASLQHWETILKTKGRWVM